MTVSADHNVIQCNILSDQFSAAVHPSFQHHAFFYLVIIRHQLIQSTVQRGLIHFCKKTQISQIDSKKRNFLMHHIPCCLKKCAISSQNNNTLCIVRNLIRICIMKGTLMFPFCLLYFTVFVMCFQIICDFFCDFKFFILVTVCNNIKPVHSFFLTQPF